VFVVASARDGFDPAQVLFEWDGVRRDLAPRRGQAEDAAGTLAGGSRQRGGYSHDDAPIVGTLTSHAKGDNPGHESKLITGTLLANGKAAGSATQQDAENGMLVTHSLRGEGFDASEDGTGRGTPLVPVQPLPFDTTQITSATNRCRPEAGDPCHPLAAQAHPPAIAFDCKASGQNGFGIGEIASTQRAMGHAGSHTNGGGHQAALVGAQVRRLMPEECEPLQGFPIGYTRIPWRGRPAAECPDGPRYKALGNSWAVPVARWVGQRVDSRIAAL
jgi:DNA (cytosine-5)-methyltransferase 1